MPHVPLQRQAAGALFWGRVHYAAAAAVLRHERGRGQGSSFSFCWHGKGCPAKKWRPPLLGGMWACGCPAAGRPRRRHRWLGGWGLGPASRRMPRACRSRCFFMTASLPLGVRGSSPFSLVSLPDGAHSGFSKVVVQGRQASAPAPSLSLFQLCMGCHTHVATPGQRSRTPGPCWRCLWPPPRGHPESDPGPLEGGRVAAGGRTGAGWGDGAHSASTCCTGKKVGAPCSERSRADAK